MVHRTKAVTHRFQGGRHAYSIRSGRIFGVLGVSQALAAPPEPLSITPALVEAAKKEGVVSYYTAVDVKVAEKVVQAFKEKYPGIEVQVERTARSVCSSASARRSKAASIMPT